MTLKEIINVFATMEESAASIFEKIAYSTKEASISKAAIIFSEEEKLHRKKLMDLSNRIEEVPIEVEGVENLIEEYLEAEKKLQKFEFYSEKDFFIFALQAEKRTMALYDALKDIFEKNSLDSQLFSNFIEDEKNHMYFILSKLHEED